MLWLLEEMKQPAHTVSQKVCQVSTIPFHSSSPNAIESISMPLTTYLPFNPLTYPFLLSFMDTCHCMHKLHPWQQIYIPGNRYCVRISYIPGNRYCVRISYIPGNRYCVRISYIPGNRYVTPLILCVEWGQLL